MAGNIYHKWVGSVLTITSDSGTSSSDLKGAKGDDGARGAQGAPGSSVAEDSQKLGGVAAAQYALKNGVPAHNLLDNSDFRNPVNQRGKNTYNNTGNEYTIDRWKTQYGTNISIENGYINIFGDWELYQIIQNPKDGIYTFAVRIRINSVGQYQPVIYVNDGSGTGNECLLDANIGEWKTYILQHNLSSTTGETITFALAPRGGNGTGSISVEWAAMYKGAYDASTLPAYQPKGYAAELAECMRYYKTMGFPAIPCANNPAGTQVYGFLPFRMRIDNPTVSCDTLYFFKGDTTFCSVSSASAASYGTGTRIVFTLSQSVEGNLAGTVAGNGITLNADF